MIDIGLVGLDTSHARAFANALADLDDMQLHGVWDGEDVRETTYVKNFCETHDARRYGQLAQLVDQVDAAMVLTVNWETHRPIATQFLEAGIPTLVDKPIAGHCESIDAIADAAEHAPLFGGSAVPFHPRFDHVPRGEDNRTIFAAGYNDFFYYRVHLTDTLRLLADADWVEVMPTDKPGTTIDVRFADDTYATLRFDGCPDHRTFSVLDVGARTRTVEIPANRDTLTDMYGPYIETFRAIVRRERDDTNRLIDSGRLLLAIEAALDRDRTVRPNDDAIKSVHVDGTEFLDQYDPYY